MVDFRFLDRAYAELSTVILGATYSSVKFPIYMWFNTQFYHHFFLLIKCKTKSADEDDRKPSENPSNCVGTGSTGSGQKFKVMVVEPPKEKTKRPQISIQPCYINKVATASHSMSAIANSISPYEDGSDEVFASEGFFVPNGRTYGHLLHRQKRPQQSIRPRNVEGLQVLMEHRLPRRSSDSSKRMLPQPPKRYQSMGNYDTDRTPKHSGYQPNRSRYAYDNSALLLEPSDGSRSNRHHAANARTNQGYYPPPSDHRSGRKRTHTRSDKSNPHPIQKTGYPMIQTRSPTEERRRPLSSWNTKPWQVGDYDDGTSGIWI